jgi:hypothetical protein
MACLYAYSFQAPFLCNRCDTINDSVFTRRDEPTQWSALTYLRRTAADKAVDMECSIVIDLSFFVAKEMVHQEEISVFGSRYDF